MTTCHLINRPKGLREERSWHWDRKQPARHGAGRVCNSEKRKVRA